MERWAGVGGEWNSGLVDKQISRQVQELAKDMTQEIFATC